MRTFQIFHIPPLLPGASFSYSVPVGMKESNLDEQMKRAINLLEFIHVSTELGASDAKYVLTGGQCKDIKSNWTHIFTVAS